MRGTFEAALALGAALALHLAAFIETSDEVGASSSGAGGTEMVSVEGAPATIKALVEEWDRPPDPQTDARMAAPVVPAPAPEAPTAMPAFDAPRSSALTPLPETPATPDRPLSPTASASPSPPKDVPEPTEVEPEPKPEPATEPSVQTAARPLARPEQLTEPRPAPQAQPARQTSTAQAEQRASGAGGGAHAGQASQAVAATVSQARLNDLKAGWGGAIRSRIERRKSYPRQARGASGTATVVLSVGRDGRLLGAGLSGSSGNPQLDKAAIDAVRSAGRFPAAPAEIREAQHRFTLRIRFDP